MGHRRARTDPIEVFEMFHGLWIVDINAFFELGSTGRTRGHRLKLKKGRVSTDLRQHFFSERIIARSYSGGRHCQGKLSVRLSVCNVDVSWSHMLEFCENNFTADKPNLFTLRRPQRPKEKPPNFSRNRSGERKNVDFRHLSRRL